MIFAEPALPLDEAGKYVVAAYLVFLALLLIYVAIMGVRVSRMERDLAELDDVVREQKASERDPEALGVPAAEPAAVTEGIRPLSPEAGPRGGT